MKCYVKNNLTVSGYYISFLYLTYLQKCNRENNDFDENKHDHLSASRKNAPVKIQPISFKDYTYYIQLIF